MLARRGRKYADDGLFPEAQRPQQAAALFCFALLFVKYRFHLAFIVGAEIKRQHSYERAKKLLRKTRAVGWHRRSPLLCELWFTKQFFGAGLRERFFHPFGLGDGDFAAQFCKQVVAPPFIIQHDLGPPARLCDTSGTLQARQVSVQRPRAQPHLVIRSARHFFQNGVTVFFAVCQCQQNVKHRRRERKICFRGLPLGHSLPRLPVVPIPWPEVSIVSCTTISLDVIVPLQVRFQGEFSLNSCVARLCRLRRPTVTCRYRPLLGRTVRSWPLIPKLSACSGKP